MAISAEASTVFQEITFAAAVDPPTVASATRLLKLAPGDNVPVSKEALGDQVAFVTVTHSAASGTATLVFFLADDDSVGGSGAGKVYQDTATIAATTTRQSHSTAAGDYVCTVTFAVSGKNTLDLMRYGKGFPRWYCACTVLSGGTVTVRVATARAI